MSVFKGARTPNSTGSFFRLMALMQACTVEGGHGATVDHAVIRGLVTDTLVEHDRRAHARTHCGM